MSYSDSELRPSERRRKGARNRRSPVATEPPANQLALSANQVAWLLGVSPNTVWNLLRDRRLPSFSVGRRRLISRSAVEAFIAGGETREGRK